MEYTDKTNDLLEKKQFSIIMFVFALFMTILFTLTALYVKSCISDIEKKIESANINEVYVPAISQDKSVSEEVIYEVKEYNGKIAVFENDSLIYTLDTYIFTLPEEDKKFLSDGIKTSDKEELLEILEEYY